MGKIVLITKTKTCCEVVRNKTTLQESIVVLHTNKRWFKWFKPHIDHCLSWCKPPEYSIVPLSMFPAIVNSTVWVLCAKGLSCFCISSVLFLLYFLSLCLFVYAERDLDTGWLKNYIVKVLHSNCASKNLHGRPTLK